MSVRLEVSKLRVKSKNNHKFIHSHEAKISRVIFCGCLLHTLVSIHPRQSKSSILFLED